MAEGVFKKNPDKSFSESKGNLQRHPINDDRNSYTNSTNAITAAVEGYEKELGKKSDDEIDAQVARDTGKPLIATPDQSYGYSIRAAEKENAGYAASYAVVTDIVKTIVEEEPPRLFDLTDLQIEASRRFGMTAAETLACAQKLYEAELLTYPRTSSHSITSDMEETVSSLLSDTEGDS